MPTIVKWLLPISGIGVSMVVMDKSMQSAQKHLLESDPILAPIIATVGDCPLKPHNRYYQELVEAIIGQQLSIKAAATITRRFLELFDGKFPTPEEILAKKQEQLRSAGLSNAKTNYIKDLAQHIADGSLLINQLHHLGNEEVMTALIAIKGIGEWTAHMFLIFSLGRLDVLPVGDLGLRSGIQKLYGLKRLPTEADVKAIATKNRWHPYQSVATWYIWQSLNNK